MVYFELKKILGKTGSKIALLLLAAVVAMMCYIQTHEKSSQICWANEQGDFEIGFSSSRKLREAQKEWSGVLDENMLRRVLSFLKQHPDFHERQGANQIRALLNCSYQKKYKYTPDDYFNAEKVESSQVDQFYQNREALMHQWLYDDSDPYNNGFDLYSDREKEFLMDRIRTLETPLQIDSIMGWHQATKAAVGVSTIGVIILGYLLTSIFTDECRWKTEAVFFSTLYGRKQAVKAKIKAAFLLTTVLYWSTTFLSGIYLFAYFGFDGYSCPIQIESKYWFSIYHLNFLQRYLLVIGSNYLGWLFMASLVMLLSAACKASVFPVIAPVFLNIIPMWLMGTSDVLPKVLKLFPTSLFTLFLEMSDMTVYSIGGIVTTAVPILMLLYTSLTLLFTWTAYHIFCIKKIF